MGIQCPLQVLQQAFVIAVPCVRELQYSRRSWQVADLPLILKPVLGLSWQPPVAFRYMQLPLVLFDVCDAVSLQVSHPPPSHPES